MELSNKGGTKRKRFNSLKSAQGFAKETGGKIIDCTNNPESKSKYKVKYSRDGARNHENKKLPDIFNEDD